MLLFLECAFLKMDDIPEMRTCGYDFMRYMDSENLIICTINLVHGYNVASW